MSRRAIGLVMKCLCIASRSEHLRFPAEAPGNPGHSRTLPHVGHVVRYCTAASKYHRLLALAALAVMSRRQQTYYTHVHVKVLSLLTPLLRASIVLHSMC